MNSKKGLVAGVAVIILALAGCSSTGTGGPAADLPASVDLKGETVVSLFTTMSNDYFSSWNDGAQRAVTAFNGTYVGLANDGDPATQLSQFQQQVDAGVKIFFVVAPDPANVPAMADIAEQNDVCFVNSWEQPPWTSPFDSGDQYVGYYTGASFDAAYEVASALFEEMEGKGNVVHLTGHPGAVPDTQRNGGFDKALAENPGITVLAEEPGEWNRDDARNAMAGIISRFGIDKIDGVFGQNDDVAIGALNALTEVGVTGDALPPITGMDGNLSTMELIQNGQIFGSYSSLPQWQAGWSFVQALDFCKGGQVPSALNRQLWQSGLFVTAETVDDYVDTYTGSNDPYDWVKMSRVAHPDDWDPQNGLRVLDIDEMWSSIEPQPAGFEYPAEYEAALSDIDAVNAEWDEHWKLVRP